MLPGHAKFARYQPARRRPDCLDFSVRKARRRDISQIADIAYQREGGRLDEHRRGAGREIERFTANKDSGLVLVAEWRGGVAGFARVHYIATPDGASPEDLPEGWYLVGIIVSPRFRRRGAGLRLTEERIAWVARRASVVRYFASLENRASIDLHVNLGFREVRRGIVHPTVEFAGGVGALYELVLDNRP